MSVRTFGAYGGRYVPETLIPALDELEARVGGAAQTTTRSAPSCTSCATSTPGRPTPLTRVERFAPDQRDVPEARGPDAHRRAQAEQRARPGA